MNDNDGTNDNFGLDDEERHILSSTDLFGRFSVIGPGVHIVLDGRPVSRGSEGI